MQTEILTDEQLNKFSKNIIKAVESRCKILPLNSLKRHGYYLRRPIYITIENDGDNVIASIDEIEAFAYADTEFEAINRLCDDIVCLYNDLRSDSENLGILPQKWFVFLNELIECHEDNADTKDF